MNCFMGYNPLVAKEVKITTWIKEFDGESPVYPSFPNDGDCFVVFATDEDALTHNALSKKTYTNGDWADAEGGSTPTGTIEITENGEGIDVSSYAYADVNVSGGGDVVIFTYDDDWSCNKTFNEVVALVGEYGDDFGNMPCKGISNLSEVSWDVGEYATDFDVSAWTDMPDTVTAIFVFSNYSVAFADDGKYYVANF